MDAAATSACQRIEAERRERAVDHRVGFSAATIAGQHSVHRRPPRRTCRPAARVGVDNATRVTAPSASTGAESGHAAAMTDLAELLDGRGDISATPTAVPRRQRTDAQLVV